MVQKYGYQANQLAKPDFVCIVCEKKNPGFNWADRHGEGMCNNCGIPYDLKAEGQPCCIKEVWIPVCREYFKETGKYMGLGTIMVERDYPECVEGRKAFSDWIKANDKAPEGEE